MPTLRSKLTTATASSTVAVDTPKISSVPCASSATPSVDEAFDSRSER